MRHFSTAERAQYYKACLDATETIRQYNPCNIRKENGKTTCNGDHSHSESLCCFQCVHLTPEGCGTMSLGCKTWLCRPLREDPKNSELLDKLIKIQRREPKDSHIFRDSPFPISQKVVKRLTKGATA